MEVVALSVWLQCTRITGPHPLTSVLLLLLLPVACHTSGNNISEEIKAAV